MADTAEEFYGPEVWARCNQEKLESAFKWLNKAVGFEENGDKVKLDMSFKAAVRAEQEAFAGK
jgi:hypothetical protein